MVVGSWVVLWVLGAWVTGKSEESSGGWKSRYLDALGVGLVLFLPRWGLWRLASWLENVVARLGGWLPKIVVADKGFCEWVSGGWGFG